MTSYLDRYLAGEHEQVWRELTRLGEQASTGAVQADARAVARETMRRARHNIEVLIPRLHRAGYAFGLRALGLEETLPGFAESYRDFAPPPPDIGRQLDALEQRAGALPLSLAAWYEAIGEVNLVGRPPDSWYLRPRALDPFQVHPFELVVEFYAEWRKQQAYSFSLPEEEKDADEIAYFSQARLEIMLDVDTKLGYSGLGGYEVIVPSLAADAPLLGHPQRLSFVDYVRLSCRWGGFPGLEFERARPEESEESVHRLTTGLLPL
jgi:hypothetical protein